MLGTMSSRGKARRGVNNGAARAVRCGQGASASCSRLILLPGDADAVSSHHSGITAKYQ
jgi:hypothetical protein